MQYEYYIMNGSSQRLSHSFDRCFHIFQEFDFIVTDRQATLNIIIVEQMFRLVDVSLRHEYAGYKVDISEGNVVPYLP